MRHGHSIVPEPNDPFNPLGFAADPEGDIAFRNRGGRHFQPSPERAAARNGKIGNERAALDAEAREWLAWALEEFRDTGFKYGVSIALAIRTLKPTTEKEIADAISDDIDHP